MQIDFTKYQKMNERQKFNALLKEKREIEKMKERIKFKKSVVGYLQGELNFFLEQEFNDELKEAVEEIKNGGGTTCKTMEEFKAKMAED